MADAVSVPDAAVGRVTSAVCLWVNVNALVVKREDVRFAKPSQSDGEPVAT